MADLQPWFWDHGPADAPLLLCLHGIGSCADAFVGQRRLAGRCGRRVVAWDAPGYRRSPDPASEPGIDGWADAAAALIGKLGYEQADVVGVSWGGVTATRLTLRHPGLVRSLVLADSSVGSGTDPERAAAMRARAEVAVELGIEQFARDRSPRLLSSSAPADLIAEAAVMMSESIRMPAYRWACNSMAEADHRTDLATISCPTLVVVGDQDVVTGAEAAAELADGIPGASLVTIEGAGHIANQEKPEAFNLAVADFLAAADERSP